MKGRLVLTLDRGFGDVRSYPPGSHAGIVVLRPDDLAPASVVAAVLELVDHHDFDDLAGTVTVVQRGILRVRPREVLTNGTDLLVPLRRNWQIGA